MRKDIKIPEVKNVTLAVTCPQSIAISDEWSVYIINNNDFPIENVLILSKGYGQLNGLVQETSTMRHFLEDVPAHGSAKIELIDPSVFHLNNEYCVSYYVDKQIHDKRFVFVPDTIHKDNLLFIKELEMEGVLHS